MSAKYLIIDDSHAGQRIDNFLIGFLKGVPHSRVYKALRKGEVRVNKGRVQALYRLALHDSVRIPPLRVAERDIAKPSARLRSCIDEAILFEDDNLIVINKPSGLAVHAGSDVQCGLIEALREMRHDTHLSLAHRLDRDTSGCLLITKNRKTLLELQALQKNHLIQKTYALLVEGTWNLGKKKHVTLSLLKNQLKSGERMVVVDDAGKPAETIFEPMKIFQKTTLLRAQLITGRTHQIRVHASALGFPIVGDEKYGTKSREKRLFLHAQRLVFTLSGKKPCVFEAPIPDEFTQNR
ncbi:MAG: hypothetical protein A3I77_05110 [Gammaproteobacteria bacterium RIFCSPLOWO2_02_FULL_42_14]|nr:MAG: hypothetical protein A3B71_01675 [Gammaproteobacteria bacterium RIFCSPHIGHO2_02_FULL_42_43]OGT28162.1 MAG: hypothetical protein A2624_05310 [Gammaproteobacteria bacterium RIFCSPHIGHO2_01_FULL_42_8]OGT51160.1 MAG: hypothetical protein A3E54_02865 [Gammaproteobacteria bacterium RIFCSPHIGHO2_12_FULL_41_25]OGT62922.1 MAG: hypothetical protein A3I77_05110 [Gammaproteobacteria bacterium RIFCSPLOWO2_02_FULL_42_14]OGT86054.1 MAG: hypothetical protein A3G86_02665 [Gammaproteobacteria bacterium R